MADATGAQATEHFGKKEKNPKTFPLGEGIHGKDISYTLFLTFALLPLASCRCSSTFHCPREDVAIVTAFAEAARQDVHQRRVFSAIHAFPKASQWKMLSLRVKGCSFRRRVAIHEFPEDIFTKEQRKRGAILLHVLCAVYMFYALAIVCDDYFVPSLEKISENLQLSEDVAGATFMAAGSSAPELFTSLIGVFITKGDVGVGTIVGSAVFNILVIIGVCGIFARQTVALTWWSMFRDSLYYILSVLALILVELQTQCVQSKRAKTKEVHVSQTLSDNSEVVEENEMEFFATLYVFEPEYTDDEHDSFNSQIASFVQRSCGNPGQCCVRRQTSRDKEADEAGANGNTSMVLLRKAPAGSGQESSVVMVDEMLIMRPHQLSFPEAGLRVMITPHFSPRTRLSMAGRMLISERQRLLRENRMSRTSVKTFGSRGIVNGGSVEAQQTPEDTEMMDGQKGVKVDVENSQPEEEDEDGDEMFRPLHFPAGYCARLKWLVSWPLAVLLYYTVPNCVLPRWHRWFMVTFIASTLWIAIFSYLMVWMVTIISYTLDIPDYIMGITFLAAGTSVPDCMASLIVARQGLGDMAVSNSIGSNIFDILLGLGFPWALRTLVVDHGSAVSINNKGLVYSVILLLASVFLTVLSVHLNGWKLDRRLGFGLMLLYSIFLLCSILFGQL
ncbi:Sodium/potassium/calcium exchanger 3 [Labeo rohita]|uniref:Sodium/potassium/calcium exchanger 3 n=1 Tax=Labeo rohita TaxID=84645 RepID=A0ABQ8MIY8_LABRO|nr:Sodium/potassium/calcium exchanger 3 [Labeo rohita]